jgi:hypothetical protein
MLEALKKYFRRQSKPWKMAMIFSMVLFLLIFFIIVWNLPVFSKKSRFTAVSDFIELAAQKNFSTEQKCVGCVRRLLDGVYASPEEENLPPVAVMIDNHSDASPQAGLEKASLVYEAEVEGGYTRFMAVFATVEKIAQIGPVRSARPYFVDWAQEIGAVYAHCGGSPEALVAIEQRGLADLNEMYNGQYFWRPGDRSAPHNIFTSSDNLNKFLENKKISNDGYPFWQFKNDTPVSSSSVDRDIVVNYKSPGLKAVWVYNKADNDYIRYSGGQPFFSAGGNLVSAKNIVIQFVPAKVIDDKLRLKMSHIGSGSAIICLDGLCREGDWSKSSASSRTKFSYKEAEEVSFNAGQTWIEVVRPELKVDF